MNEYIKGLAKDKKLNYSIDKKSTFEWQYTKIAGPCSVEGPDIVEIARTIKSLGANAFCEIAWHAGEPDPSSDGRCRRGIWRN